MKKDRYSRNGVNKKVLRGGVHHRNYERRGFLSQEKNYISWTNVDRIRCRVRFGSVKMSEHKSEKDTECEAISDKKQCNKFSIENILGLNDGAKVSRLELMNFCGKGKMSIATLTLVELAFTIDS